MSIAIGPAHYDFPSGAYYADVPELLPYAGVPGWLSTVLDTYPTTNPGTVQATRTTTYTEEASDVVPLVAERWIGPLLPATATNCARLDTLAGFSATSGNNAYGADAGDVVQILGPADTPILAGMGYFTITQAFLVQAVGTGGGLSRVRLAWGNSTFAAAITAGQFTEFVVGATAGQFQLSIPQLPAGTLMWVNIWNATNDAKVDFMFAIQEATE